LRPIWQALTASPSIKQTQTMDKDNQETNQRPDGNTISQSPLFKKIMAKAERYLEHPSQVAKLLNDAFKKATAKKSLGALAAEAWESFQVLFHMIRSAMNGEYKGIPNTVLVGGVAVIIYFLMPLDLIPDFIPVIGLLDDAALLAWFMASIRSELDRFKDWDTARQQQQQEAAHNQAPHNADASFGTPKFSDQPATTISTASEHEVIAHASQGHVSPEPGHQEPTLRTSTTDSSRSAKNPYDDLPDGGNVR
jgi:uncharacterized membrane protein YkvA (DUF1232 family)